MNNIINNKTSKEIRNTRIRNYGKKIEKKPILRNQILVHENNACMIINGDMEQCAVKGYIKVPGSKMLERIENLNLAVSILPKEKLIILVDNESFFKGYKEENDDDFLLLLYAEKEEGENCLIVDCCQENIPPYIEVGYCEEGELNFSERLFGVFESILLNESHFQLKEIDVDELEEGGEKDEE